MQHFIRSIALIRKPSAHRTSWLARWQNHSRCYDFIMAEPLEEESFRECIDREVGWVLKLERERDYLVANMAQINLDFCDALPGDAHETHIVVAFYVVDLYRKSAWKLVDADGENCWLSAEEIYTGFAQDQRPIEPNLRFLIRHSEVIQPWQ
jgi:hypothetical protein